MISNKSLSAILLAAITSATCAFGAAADGFSNNSGRHFRSPYQSNLPARTVTETAEPEELKTTQLKTVKSTVNDDSLFPPSAKPGECYTRVLVSPPLRDISERVRVKEESVRLVEIPAVVEQVEEQTIVRPATQRQEIIPATYKEIEENVLVTAASTKQIPVPAVYETRSERVLVKAERSYWKKGHGPLSKVDNTTGEIMCYVTDPAVYETVNRSILVTPATVREEVVPAKYKLVKRTVVDVPASIQTIEVPAEYAPTKVSRVVTAARVEREVVPAEYRTITKQVSDGESRMGWRRIICETNVTPALVSDLQTSLNAKGYQAGEVTGELNSKTLKALESFQIASNLPQGGVTVESLDALGVRQ